MDVKSQQSTVVTDDGSAKEVVWIDDETIVFLQSEDDGTTSIGVGDPENFGKRYILILKSIFCLLLIRH